MNGKHARWWNKVHSSGIREVDIIYRAKHNNCHADALSRQPVLPPTLEDDNAEEVQVALVSTQDIDDGGIIDLLSRPANTGEVLQMNSGVIVSYNHAIILYLRDGELPDDVTLAKKIVAESALYTMADSILYYVGPKSSETPRAVVPAALQQQVMIDHHSGCLVGYFSGPRLYKTLACKWWWKRMY